MSSHCPRESGVEALSTNRGAVLPFLPTLATAIVVAAASLLCRQPAPTNVPPAPSMTAPAGNDGFHHANAATPASVPAVIAFAQLQPPALQAATEADSAAKPAAARPARLAANTGRRLCTGGRCESRRPDAVRTAAGAARPAIETNAPLPFAPVAETDTDEGLPGDALPFAPTAASWAETVRSVGARIGSSVGSEAASLGGSVIDLIACAR